MSNYTEIKLAISTELKKPPYSPWRHIGIEIFYIIE